MDWFEWAMKVLVVVGGAGIAFGLIAASVRVALGRPSRRRQWLEKVMQRGPDPGNGQELVDLRQSVDRLSGEVAELHERLDFAERVLAQQRERPALPDR